MPKTTDTILDRFLLLSKSLSTLDITLRGSQTTQYFASKRITIGSQLYLPKLPFVNKNGEGDEALGELKESGNQSQNRVEVKVSNIDGGFGLHVASAVRPLELANAIARILYCDPTIFNPTNPDSYRHEHYFSGKLIGAEANEKYVSATIIPKSSACGVCIATRALSIYNGYTFPGVPVEGAPGTPINPGGGIGGGVILPPTHCCLAGTLILTPRGERPVETIKTGEQVYSFNPRTREIEIDVCIANFAGEAAEYYEFVFADDTRIQVTREHPFLTAAGKWRTADDLRIGGRATVVWKYDKQWQKVKLIKIRPRVQAVPVFNLWVKKNRNYLGNSLALHNKEFDPEHPLPV